MDDGRGTQTDLGELYQMDLLESMGPRDHDLHGECSWG